MSLKRGTARQTTFVDEADYQTFLNTVAVFFYCLMRNHYHLCLRTPKAIFLASCAISMDSIPSDLTVKWSVTFI